MLKESKLCQAKILYPVKIPSRMKAKIKTFSEKRKLTILTLNIL